MENVKIRVAGALPMPPICPSCFSRDDTDDSDDTKKNADPLLGEDASPEAYPMREFAVRCAPIENALARGDIASALGQLQALTPLDADDRIGTTACYRFCSLAKARSIKQVSWRRRPLRAGRNLFPPSWPWLSSRRCGARRTRQRTF